MWVRGSDFGVNVGFLVLGVLLSIATTLVAEIRERNLKTTDLARVYAETAHLVARCCFDSEAPWKEYWIGRASPGSMNSVRLRKFTPVVPVVYLATAGQLSLLRGTAPQDLIEFQYRLSALRREIENIANDAEFSRMMDPIELGALKLVGTAWVRN
jgi:hypothetical protein